MGMFDDLQPSAAPASGGGMFSDLAPPAAPLTRGERFTRGLRDPIDGGAQLLTKALPAGVVEAGNRLNNWLADTTGLVGRLPEGGVDQQVREAEAEYQARRRASEPVAGTTGLVTGQRQEPGVDWMRIGGNVLNPANIAIASRIPAAASLTGRIGLGALGGGVSASLNPVTSGDDFLAEKTKQVGTGAAFGALVPAATAVARGVISPAASTNPQLALLRSEGVRPTIGQTLGGAWNRAEEKLSSLPLVGDSIAGARSRAQEDFNRAALNRALSPIGQSADEVGQGGVAAAQGAVKNAYSAAEAAMGNFRLDRQGASELRNVQSMAQSLADKERGQFNTIWNTIAGDISPNGTIAQGAFKKIDSKLGADAARFSGSTDAYQQQLGDAVSQLQKSIRDNALRANPRAADLTSKADAAYANLVRVEGASKAALGNGGVFTPGQLNTAVRQADRSVRDRATAGGKALMQDLSSAGQSVLGNRVPNSGTVDRALLLGTGAGAYANPMLAGAGLLGGMAAYTPTGQALLRSAVTLRPQAAQTVSNALLKASPGFVPTGAQVGLGLLD
ncbi:MAG: hypothetical protein DI563_01885 [Variovorax paradoxus]|uniref:Uncharacterized protein n=1 Tax=Variovorax paradoxus TaxID=34073 RepID=A0A2W5QKX6_VARPD|nr:MAG: hypothetical protein DI563_01885 [Variovorax paradoxus]